MKTNDWEPSSNRSFDRIYWAGLQFHFSGNTLPCPCGGSSCRWSSSSSIGLAGKSASICCRLLEDTALNQISNSGGGKPWPEALLQLKWGSEADMQQVRTSLLCLPGRSRHARANRSQFHDTIRIKPTLKASPRLLWAQRMSSFASRAATHICASTNKQIHK